MGEKGKKSKTLRLRLKPSYLEKLQAYADKRDLSMTEVLTRYIQRLPNS